MSVPTIVNNKVDNKNDDDDDDNNNNAGYMQFLTLKDNDVN